MIYQAGILILGLVPALLFAALARLDRGGPSPMMALAWTFALGHSVKSVYLAWAAGSGAPFRTMDASRGILDLGQAAIVLCALAIAAGYLGARAALDGRIRPAGPHRPPRLDMRPIYWGAFALSALLMALFFHRMGFAAQLADLRLTAAKWFVSQETGTVSALGFLTIGGDVLLVLFAHRHARLPRPAALDPHTLAIAACCLCYLLASRRSGVLIVLILYAMVARRADLAALARRALLAALALACVAAAGQARLSGGARLTDLDPVGAAAATAAHVLEGAYFIDPAKTAVIVSEVSRRDLHLRGESYVRFLAAPVPRLMWPGKPDVRIGPWVAREILGYQNESGVPPGGIGELFLNFGWGGVALGGLLIGAGLAVARARSRPGPSSDVGFALATLCVILYLVGDFSAAMLAAIKYGAAHALAVRYWAWREARANGPVTVEVAEAEMRPILVRRGRASPRPV